MNTSTIIPGRSRPLASTISMRTGRRCVTLVKWPLGFGLGSRANWLVAAEPMVLTLPEIEDNRFYLVQLADINHPS